MFHLSEITSGVYVAKNHDRLKMLLKINSMKTFSVFESVWTKIQVLFKCDCNTNHELMLAECDVISELLFLVSTITHQMTIII
jgi:hypothetical protein